MTEQRKAVLLGAMLLASAAFGVFLLPFILAPEPAPVVSASLAAGFNNRVAGLVAICLSAAAVVAALRWRVRTRLPEAETCEPMTRGFRLSGVLTITGLMAVLGVLAYLADIRMAGEARYFVEQMSKADAYGLKLYRDVEFGYGPLLFYPTLLLKPLLWFMGKPVQAAYVVTLLIHEFLGALLLAWVMQQLPIALHVRRWFFVFLLGCSALNLGLGLNYALLRFTFPLASLLFSTRIKNPRRMAAVVFTAELINCGISPEMGIAFAAGATCFGVLQVWRRQTSFLPVALAPLAGVLLFLGVEGPTYLDTIRQFSGGAYNLIVEPQLYTVLFLIEVIWLAPVAMATAWLEKRNDSVVLTSLFVSGLALLPVAFGRADGGHIVLNSMPILLLSLIPISSWGRRLQYAWVGVASLIWVMLAMVALHTYRVAYRGIVTQAALRSAPVGMRRALVRWRPPTTEGLAETFGAEHPPLEHSIDVAQLRRITAGEPIAAPGGLQPVDEDALREAGLYSPPYYQYAENEFSPTAESRSIAETNRSKWLLVEGGRLINWTETPELLKSYMGLPLPYHTRRPVFTLGLQLNKNIDRNWRAVGTFRQYTLYRRRW